MHTEALTGSASPPSYRNSWRLAVDRAWQSRKVRRQFEGENDLVPLAEDEAGRMSQVGTGYTKSYQDLFTLWATRNLGLEDQAPAPIRAQLS
ncbi:hypothetical protein C1T17_19880 (plasmid) [Sphingobium sp. SCG-1]|uniref:hypothetical protein n=1 Tax=Sphingobium sp. SCG-1 TaxID=2072936 RepID=UPI000CD6A52E|nr:hypothetical protein [Sphingobium sp. SCG-1]AUW60502.1 hypothetical protein C1T17_19880 [Sphingobium sp. SCG-1]